MLYKKVNFNHFYDKVYYELGLFLLNYFRLGIYCREWEILNQRKKYGDGPK